MQTLISLFFDTPRRTLAWFALAIASMLGFGIYLQHVVGLEPCPMCIVQRYVYVFMLLLAVLGALGKGCRWHAAMFGLIAASAAAGAFVAARQSWLQWNPPEFSSCGRDFYGMVEQLPLSQALPRIFAGSGDCAAVDWTLLGGTIANWSFLGYVGFGLVSIGWLLVLYRRWRKA